MSSTSNQIPKSEKSPPQQSDIVIDPDGKIHISFLWEDLRDLPRSLNEKYVSAKPAFILRNWNPTEFKSPDSLLSEYEHCKLCPKECGFNRVKNKHPTCGDFELRVATFGISFGDEPEIRGTGGSGAIMLSGCPLKCPSCHNPEKVADGTAINAQDFFSLCKKLYEDGAHNIQILSPTVHMPILRVLLRSLKSDSFPIPIVLKSSGYESVDQLRSLEGLVDIYLPDFKFGQCSQWSQRAGVKNYFEVAVAALHEMARQVGALEVDDQGVATKGVLVRHVQAPLPSAEKTQIRNFLNQLPEGIRVSYQDNFVSLE